MNKRVVIIIGMLLTSTVVFSQNKTKVQQDIKKEIKKDSQAVKETSQKVWKATKVEAKNVADKTGDYTLKVEKKVRKDAPVKWEEVKKDVTKESKEVRKKVKSASKKLKSEIQKKKN